MKRGGCIYIMANEDCSTLYVGVTSDLYKRVWEHKSGKYPHSFTSRYGLHKLVYYEGFHHIEEAIAREKQIKGGSRIKKEALIDKLNPARKDLFEEIEKW